VTPRMLGTLPFFLPPASVSAEAVGSLGLFLTVVSLCFCALVFGAILLFTLLYSRRTEHTPPPVNRVSAVLTALYLLVPLSLVTVLFAWGTSLQLGNPRPPDEAMEIRVLGMQWMWKFQHPEGRQEINELHVPLGRPVRLTMSSQDVGHTLSIPAFRLKARILPGRSASAWFQATRAGQYHLFCVEYCGARHSGMRGTVIVMDPRAYQHWMSGETEGASPTSLGVRLFADLKCGTCHRADGAGRGPALEGLLGRTVTLRDGSTIIADEAYIRESILNPGAKQVANFEPVMPAFQGQLTEEQVLRILAYLETLEAGASGRTQP